MKKMKLTLGSPEKGDSQLRLFVTLSAAVVIFVAVIALSVFFASLRGAEQTMVPDVRGKDLADALLALQVKELYPRLQMRYSQNAAEKGRVLEQDPPGGTIVKAGRRIRLVVSRGVVLNKTANYLGRDIDEVRLEMQTLFASGQALLTLREPFLYQYSPEPAGTILEQDPLPDAPLSGPVELVLVVSRGPQDAPATVPDLGGLSMEQALLLVGQAGFSFTFDARAPRGNEPGERVVYQDPAGGALAAADTVLTVRITEPARLEPGEVFGFFDHPLPENPYPLPVTLEAALPSGERRLLIAMNHRGGAFTVPYRLPQGSTLILSMMDRELLREEVAPGTLF